MATEIKKYLSLEKLKKYDEKIKGVVTTGDAATLQSAKDYAEGLADNYEAAGSVASALAEAKSYADGKDTAIAAAKKAGDDAQATANQGVADAAVAKGVADSAVEAVGELETYVGTIPEDYEESNVVAYINKKAQETLDAASGGSSESAASVLAALNTYKTENDPKVTAAQGAADAAKSAADAAQAHSEGVASDLVTETQARKDADDAQVGRITVLESQITGLSGAMHFKGVETQLPTNVSAYADGDVIIVGEKEYVFNDGAFVEFGDVSAEGERIKNLETHMSTYEPKVNTLVSDMATAKEDIANKVDKTIYDAKVEELAGVDTTLSERIDDLETAIGDTGSVATAIEEARDAAIETAKADATEKANKALEGAKTYTNGQIDLVEADITALESASHTHTNKVELDKIADGDVAKWNAAQTNAEATAAAALAGAVSTLESKIAAAQTAAEKVANDNNTAMDTRVTSLETWHNNFVEISEEDINGMF